MACCEEMQAAVDETRAKEHARLKLVSDSILGSYERAHEVSDLNALRAARRREIQNARAERDARREQGYGAFKEVEAADLDAEVGLAIVTVVCYGPAPPQDVWLSSDVRFLHAPDEAPVRYAGFVAKKDLILSWIGFSSNYLTRVR